MIVIYLLFFLLFNYSECFNFFPHPLEKRISYIEGIKDIRKMDKSTFKCCKIYFERYSPLIIFRNQPQLTPNEFLDFAKLFDDNRDEEAINSMSNNQSYWKMNQMLQPFDQFPECKHVAPRGNYYLKDYYGCKKLQVYPSEYFKEKYLWHSDTWGHNTKIMNKITAFYIIKQPLIGGETDFISGETIYENLSQDEKRRYKDITLQVSREPFLNGYCSMDYSGAEFEDDIYIEPSSDSLKYTPLIKMPEPDSFSKPSLIISPILVQKIKGYDVIKTRKWIKKLMNKKVLPHRVTVQWKKGDVAIFNNKLFIHSSTPANNYLKNKMNNERFLLQTFIPTKE